MSFFKEVPKPMEVTMELNDADTHEATSWTSVEGYKACS